MKILCIADRAPKVSIQEVLRDYPVDAIFTLGDLDYFGLRELEGVTTPKFGVYGNHCSKMYFDDLGIQNMHMQHTQIGENTLVGFEGSNRYKDSQYGAMFTQQEAMELIQGLPRADIIIAHSPPYGVHDEINDITHQGLQALNWYCEQYAPKLLFHGHTYPTEKQSRYHNTLVYYVHGLEVVEIDSNTSTTKVIELYSDREIR